MNSMHTCAVVSGGSVGMADEGACAYDKRR